MLYEHFLRGFYGSLTTCRQFYVINTTLRFTWPLWSNLINTSSITGFCAILPSDTTQGYMTWYFKIPHPYIIRIFVGCYVWPTQRTTTMTQLLGRLTNIRDILKGLMISDDVPNNSHNLQRTRVCRSRSWLTLWHMSGRGVNWVLLIRSRLLFVIISWTPFIFLFVIFNNCYGLAYGYFG
jgi:hypothetical protein